MKAGKVWGNTELIFKNPFIEFHRIYAEKGGFCSTHMHEHKWNLFYVTSGHLKIHVNKNDYDLTDVTELRALQWTTVKPGEFHSFEAVEDTQAFELYYPEPLSDDIIRKTVGGVG
jgi:mannose-6-phosphate isomerase-like protein (cupin superfamily)